MLPSSPPFPPFPPSFFHVPRSSGLILVAVGVVVALIGVMAMAGWLSWFGRLPGDIRIEREGVRVYFPIVSMLVVSVVLSLVLAILRRL